MEPNLEAELEAKEDEHSRFAFKDFVKAQSLLWAGILASIVASLTAADVLPRPAWLPAPWAKAIAAVVAAIPAAVILVDRTFKYTARSAWHALYAIQLRTLRRSIRDRGVPKQDVSKSLDELELEMHNLFPPLDAQVLQQKGTEDRQTQARVPQQDR